MNSRLGIGLAGFLLLTAASGMTGGAVVAGPRPMPQSLQEVPLPAPSKISPWPESTDRSQPQEAADPPAVDNQTAPASERAEVSNPDIDWALLEVDASTLMTTAPGKVHPQSRAAAGSGAMSWSSQQKEYGSAVSVKQPISPVLDLQVGADMTVVRQPQTLAELLAEKAGNGGNEPQSSGAAWASASAGGVASIWDKTTLEARIDPSQDQGKLGTSLSKSLALGEQYSLTLQNGYNMIQGFGPVPGAAGRTSYETEQSAKFGVADTGTTFSAGRSLSTLDDQWLGRIGAEQKIVGGFNVSASIAETPLGIANKSVTAGFKKSW